MNCRTLVWNSGCAEFFRKVSIDLDVAVSGTRNNTSRRRLHLTLWQAYFTKPTSISEARQRPFRPSGLRDSRFQTPLFVRSSVPVHSTHIVIASFQHLSSWVDCGRALDQSIQLMHEWKIAHRCSWMPTLPTDTMHLLTRDAETIRDCDLYLLGTERDRVGHINIRWYILTELRKQKTKHSLAPMRGEFSQWVMMHDAWSRDPVNTYSTLRRRTSPLPYILCIYISRLSLMFPPSSSLLLQTIDTIGIPLHVSHGPHRLLL